jgi:hypothetical protein
MDTRYGCILPPCGGEHDEQMHWYVRIRHGFVTKNANLASRETMRVKDTIALLSRKTYGSHHSFFSLVRIVAPWARSQQLNSNG